MVLERGNDWCSECEDRFGLSCDQLLRKRLCLICAASRRKTILDLEIAAFRPPPLLKSFPEGRDPRLCFRIVFGEAHQHGYTSRAVTLLSARRERPTSGDTANERDEISSPHRATF